MGGPLTYDQRFGVLLVLPDVIKTWYGLSTPERL